MKHFFDISDYSPEELQDLLDLAIRLKKEYFSSGKFSTFQRESSWHDFSKTQSANTGIIRYGDAAYGRGCIVSFSK